MGYYPVKLIFNSYMPEKIESGMLFAMSVTFEETSYLHVHKLEKLPKDVDKYIQENGYPVQPYLVTAIDSNPDVPPKVVATPEQIGWYEQEGMLYTFDIDDMNYISMADNGYIGVYMDDETLEPVLEDGKVVLTSMDELWAETEEDEDWDVTLDDGLENL